MPPMTLFALVADSAGVIKSSAYLIGALAILVLVAAAVVLVAKGGFSRLDAKFGSAAVSLEAVDKKLDDMVKVVDQVNKAVNCVPVGTDTLVTRVGSLEESHVRLHEHQKWESAALRAIADNVGVTLPPSPSGGE